MRADRLLATLLFLQSRGTVTCNEVAERFEVSERTARRDLDALAMAGVPLFSRQGRGGGWELVGGARTDLTGLRSGEALELLTMAAASGRKSPDFSSAVDKLVQALPGPIRDETAMVMASVVADGTAWVTPVEATAEDATQAEDWLEPLQRAVVTQRTAVILYDKLRAGVAERRVDPLGLAVKQGHWYLLAETENGRRTFRVDRIFGVTVTNDGFDRPVDFDLSAAWNDVAARFLNLTQQTAVEAIVDDTMLAALRGSGLDVMVHEAAGDQRSRVTLSAWNSHMLAAKIAPEIAHIDLIDPPAELVERLAEIGRALLTRFASSSIRG